MKVFANMLLTSVFLFVSGSAEAWTRISSTMKSAFFEARSDGMSISIGCYPGGTSVGFTIVNPTPFLRGQDQPRAIAFVIGDQRFAAPSEYFTGPDESYISGRLPFDRHADIFAAANSMTVIDATGRENNAFLTVGMNGSAGAIRTILKTCPAAGG